MIPGEYSAAGKATVITAVVIIALITGQAAVVAALTSGDQPMVVTEEVPLATDAVGWETAPRRTVDLSKQQMAYPFGGGSVDEMTVQALTNETHVGFKLSWTDPTEDISLDRPKAYSDAAAVMFHAGSTPPITMGSANKPVDVWYWRANWQYGERDTDGDMYVYPHPDGETKPGLAADNPISTAMSGPFAQDYYAKGFGSLTYAPTQNVVANGERTEEGWSVVFLRERAANGDGEFDAVFDEADTMYLAFAAWNGSANEVNGQKSITLRFSTLETKTGELSAASKSGSSSGGTNGGTSSEESGGNSGEKEPFISTEINDFLLKLVGIALVTWTIAFWRLHR